MGSEATFLLFNKGEIFWNVIHIEGHFRNVKPGYRAEDLSCVVKHSADVEGHCNEAISHALIVKGEEESRKFRELRDMVRDLREEVQKGGISPEEGIKRTREIRRFFESFNPDYDISKCRSCGSAGEALEKLKGLDLKDMESDLAKRVLESLSAKYRVEPPRLEISGSCHEPDEGYYRGGAIHLCQGGVNLHVLLHEFKHYYDHKAGRSLDEREAEDFAVETVEKGLYPPEAKHYHSGSKMDSAKDIALVIGGVNIGWGIGYAAKVYVDPLAPGVVLGQDPSLLIDAGGTIIGIIGAWKLKRDILKKLAAYIGAGLSVHLWEDLMKILAATPAAAAAAQAAAAGGAVVGTSIPGIPAMPTPAQRLAGYPFPSPVSVGGTMSPPHYMLDNVPGAPRTIALTPKYILNS